MATVASLFRSQAEATRAVDALATSEFADADTSVYEGKARPTGSTAAAEASPQGAIYNRLADLDDRELSDYFVQAMEQGQGVLVITEVDDERADDLTAFFQAQGGRTTVED